MTGKMAGMSLMMSCRGGHSDLARTIDGNDVPENDIHVSAEN